MGGHIRKSLMGLALVLSSLGLGILVLLPDVRNGIGQRAVRMLAYEPMPPWVDRLMHDHPEDLMLFARDFRQNGPDTLDDLRVVTTMNFVHEYAGDADQGALVDHARGLARLFEDLAREDPETCEQFRRFSGNWIDVRSAAPEAFHLAFEPVGRIVHTGNDHRPVDPPSGLKGATVAVNAAESPCVAIAVFYRAISDLPPAEAANTMAWHLTRRPANTLSVMTSR